MSYKKPGIEITYISEGVSPILPSPTMPAAVIGQGYTVKTISENTPDQYSYVVEDTYDSDDELALEIDVTVSGLIDSDSVYLMISEGSDRKTLLRAADSELTVVGNKISIKAYTASNGYPPTLSGFTNGRIQLGFRSYKSDAELRLYESISDVAAMAGKPDFDNPLSLAITSAMLSGGRSVYGYNTASPDTFDSDAAELFETKDMYAITPLSTEAEVLNGWLTHVNTMSSPTGKKERRLVMSLPFPEGSGKAGVSTALRNVATSYADERLILVYPPIAYVSGRYNLGKIHPDYVSSFVTGLGLETDDEVAVLNQKITLEDGTILYAGTKINETVWGLLKTDKIFFVNVLIPVPGYIAAATISGKMSGITAGDPLTNVPIGGVINSLKFSNDYFSETHLDTSGGGGIWWLIQNSAAAPVVTRHQLTTNMLSVSYREASILQLADYVGKMMRRLANPYIGRYNITPRLFNMLRITLSQGGVRLVRDGRLNSFGITSLEVDPLSSDTIIGVFDLGIPAPFNYLRLTLRF